MSRCSYCDDHIEAGAPEGATECKPCRACPCGAEGVELIEIGAGACVPTCAECARYWRGQQDEIRRGINSADPRFA